MGSTTSSYEVAAVSPIWHTVFIGNGKERTYKNRLWLLFYQILH